MVEPSGGLRIKVPDELAGVLLRSRLEGLGRAELVYRGEDGWEVRLAASGQGAVATALGLTREWLARERIAATEVVIEGETLTLTAFA